MKWQSRHVLPLLLATASLAIPSSASYYNSSRPHQATFRVDPVFEEHFLEWESPPDPNTTHHLIFNSVGGLLHRWPNTLRRNGALDPSSRFCQNCQPTFTAIFNAHISLPPRSHRSACYYPHRYNFVPWTYGRSCPRCARMACV